MKVSRACFSNFKCIFCLVKLNNCNCAVVGSEAVDCVWCCLVIQFVIRSGFPVLSNHPVIVCCF
jgi:hypothetical protein